MLSRRGIRGWIALLLPLMVLRAMLPPGYMPVASGGELRIAMCSDGLATPAAPDHSGGRDSAAGNACPFAHSAPFAPPPAVIEAGLALPAPVSLVPRLARPPVGTAPPRFTSARGPPRHS